MRPALSGFLPGAAPLPSGAEERKIAMKTAARSLLMKAYAILGLCGLLLAVASTPVQAVDPGTEPIPTLDLAGPLKSVVVLLDFDGPDHVTVNPDTGPKVVYAAPHVRLGDPPLLLVRLLDHRGHVLDEFDAWHPLWVSVETDIAGGDIPELRDPLTILDRATGRFVVPFYPNLKTMQVHDILGQRLLIAVDLEETIRAFCRQNPNDPECANVITAPTISISRDSGLFAVGEQFTVDIRLDNIQTLYGAQVDLSFDPNILEVVDAYDFLPGLQIEDGDFLIPDVTIRNGANNQAGTIQYAISRQGAKPGVSGSGTLARITFRGRGDGSSSLNFSKVVLSNPQSAPINVQQLGGQIVVAQQEPPMLSLNGRVFLERRNSFVQADVCVAATCVLSSSAGSYTLPSAPADGSVQIRHQSYLRASREYSGLVESEVSLPAVTLLGGDLNQDDRIDTPDAVTIGLSWLSAPADARWDPRADITADDATNILDMVSVQFNWKQSAPGPWPDTPILAAQAPVRLAISPTTATAPGMGSLVSLDLVVEEVANLYGFDVVVRFDPALLQVQDADPRESAPGVQIRVGDFFDPINQFVLINRVNNQAGLVELAVTQTHPAAAREGNGTLGTIVLEVVGMGSSAVGFDEVQLVDDTKPDPQLIPVTLQEGLVAIGGVQNSLYLPFLAR
jgi:hypothetical protein